LFGQVAGERPLSSPIYQSVDRIAAATIASDGDSFLVVWSDLRDHGAAYAAHIARNGTIADPRGILLAKTVSPIAVAWMGDRYLAAWNGPGGVMGTQLNSDGEIVAPPRVIAKGQLSNSPHPIASNGSVTVVMTSLGYSVLDRDCNLVEQGRFGAAAYVTGSGGFILPGLGVTRRLDAAGHFITNAFGMPRDPVACHGGGCITASPLLKTIGVATYDPETLTAGQISELPIAPSAIDLVATDGGYLLVTNAIAQRLDDAGHPIAQTIDLPRAATSVFHAASNGRDVAVVRVSPTSLSVSVITPATVTTPAFLGVSANAQTNVAIARSAFNYMTVWTEKDGTYAARMSLDGLPLDGRGRFLGASSDKPGITFDGASYLAVVGNRTLSYLAEDVLRIDPATGEVIAVSTIAGSNLRIGSNGRERVGVWIDPFGELEVAFFDPNGAMASMPVWLASPPRQSAATYLGNPSLAWNGTIWLVTWEEQFEQYRNPPPPYPYVPILLSVAIRGARLSAALTPLDVQPITIAAAPPETIRMSHIASDGADFLVAWTTGPVHVRRISASGAGDPEKLLATGSVQDLVWDGTSYHVAFATPLSDLADARLRPSGEMIETLIISATTADERSAALVPTTTGHVLAAYTRVADEPLYGGVERAFVAAPHPARGRGLSTTSEAHVSRLTHDLPNATNGALDGTPSRRQPSTLLKFTSDGPAAPETPSALFTDSVEKAAESPVQNSKERAKCGLLTALHNSMGGLTQLLYRLGLSEIRDIISTGICAVAQDSLHFPHAS